MTIDANYRLKLKDRSMLEDPVLGDGWSHYVAQGPYDEYVKEYGDIIEVCMHCVVRDCKRTIMVN